MAAHDMFFAMMLTNAKRGEARSLTLSVEGSTPAINMLLLDGSRRALTPPPADVLLRIIEALEQGERSFQSSVFTVSIEKVIVRRGTEATVALIEDWTVTHD